MISDGCPDANRKVLVQRVGECPLPTAQAFGLRWLGPTVATPRTRNGHIDLRRYLNPRAALVTKLEDLLCGDGMRGERS